MGMRSSDTAEVFFDDVRVPCKNIIGQEGMGFTYQMLQFQEERLWGVANSKCVKLNLRMHFDCTLEPALLLLQLISQHQEQWEFWGRGYGVWGGSRKEDFPVSVIITLKHMNP